MREVSLAECVLFALRTQREARTQCHPHAVNVIFHHKCTIKLETFASFVFLSVDGGLGSGRNAQRAAGARA